MLNINYTILHVFYVLLVLFHMVKIMYALSSPDLSGIYPWLVLLSLVGLLELSQLLQPSVLEGHGSAPPAPLYCIFFGACSLSLFYLEQMPMTCPQS